MSNFLSIPSILALKCFLHCREKFDLILFARYESIWKVKICTNNSRKERDITRYKFPKRVYQSKGKLTKDIIVICEWRNDFSVVVVPLHSSLRFFSCTRILTVKPRRGFYISVFALLSVFLLPSPNYLRRVLVSLEIHNEYYESLRNFIRTKAELLISNF